MPFQSPNYTQVPNELFDYYMRILNGSELKVLMVIIRKTFGFLDNHGNRKTKDKISISQIMEYTGLSNAPIVEALFNLENKYNLIGSQKAPGRTTTYLIIKQDESREPVYKVNSPCLESKQVLPGTCLESKHTKEKEKETKKKNVSIEFYEYKKTVINWFNKNYENFHNGKKILWKGKEIGKLGELLKLDKNELIYKFNMLCSLYELGESYYDIFPSKLLSAWNDLNDELLLSKQNKLRKIK